VKKKGWARDLFERIGYGMTYMQSKSRKRYARMPRRKEIKAKQGIGRDNSI
jgi:hypothetical protein